MFDGFKPERINRDANICPLYDFQEVTTVF
jgi:hypothetical protein